MFLNVTTQKKINAAENAEIQKKNAEIWGDFFGASPARKEAGKIGKNF